MRDTIRRTKIGELNFTGEAHASVGGGHFRWLWAVVVSVLFVLTGAAFADFPPYLVIDSVVYSGTAVSGTTGVMSYWTPNGVLVLHVATGGDAGWGVDETTALSAPSLSGTWTNDCSQPIVLAGAESVPLILVPQVLVSYWWSDGSDYMQGYDGNCRGAIGIGWESSGKFIAAYNGLTDGYIFNFHNNNGGMPYGIGTESWTSPIYRYQASAAPMILDTTTNGGWPSSPTISAFPSQFVYNGDTTLSLTSYGEGLANGVSGYWNNIYYAGKKPDGVTPIYGEMHLYIAGDGSTGQMWGFVDGSIVSAHWDPTTQVFGWNNVGGLVASTSGPSYGPPKLEYHGTILELKYQDAQGSDVYCDQQGQILAIIRSNYSVGVVSAQWGMNSGSYNSSSKRIFMGEDDIAAVSADGLELLGLPYAATVITNGSRPNLSADFGWGSDRVLAYSLHRPDGKTMFKFAARCYTFDGSISFPVGMCWQFQDDHGLSPIYRVADAAPVIDACSGWPPGPSLTAFPANAYVNGSLLTLDRIDGPSCINTGSYLDGASGVEYGSGYIYKIYHYSGSGLQMAVASIDGLNPIYLLANEGETLSQMFCIDGGYITHAPFLADASETITFSTLTPLQGPAQVSWNGISAKFSYSDASGADVYDTSPSGGATPFQVTIDSSRHVTVSGTSALSGTYNASTHQFNLNGGTLLAQDVVGNLLGTPTGLIIYSGSAWVGSVSLAAGGYSDGATCDWGGTIYKFKRNDGSFGIKFTGIPQDSWFIVQNEGGAVSPYYRYTETSGDFVLNTVASGGWPASNIWPHQLYVNGHYTALDSSSERTLNGGYILQVSYHIQPSGETITINWSGNYGAVTGNYATFGAFSGTWDGGNLFGGFPSGLVIATTPPSSIARFGPPQIKWNGVELVFDPFASIVSTSNPQGLDIYRDTLGLGLHASVGSDHSVILYTAAGTQLIGTYDPDTYQFNFGAQPAGTVQADSTQGFVLHSSSGRGSGDGQGASTATMEAPGNFDVQGNVFSFGNWMLSGTSTPGMMLTFTSGTSNQPSMLLFSAFRKSTDWMWCHTDTDGGTTQSTMMKLDASNRLKLFDPATQTSGTTAQPTIVLDPAVSGTSQFRGTVLIQPQGDLDMGQYTTGNAPQ